MNDWKVRTRLDVFIPVAVPFSRLLYLFLTYLGHQFLVVSYQPFARAGNNGANVRAILLSYLF